MSLFKFNNLTIKNFQTVGANTQAINLASDPLTLVLGQTTDINGNLTRNGVGKSAILQALSYVWFNKPLFRIKLGNLVNNVNGKNMLVTSEAEVNGVKLRVERGQKPAVLKFFVNGVEQKDDETEEGTNKAQGENKNTQATIERYLGMSHDMFTQVVALNTFTEPFLKMKAAEQREIMEELQGITQLSQRAATLKILIDRSKDTIRDHEALIKATISANDRVESTIAQFVGNAKRWDRDHEAELAALNESITAVLSIDFDEEIAQFDRLDAFLARESDLQRNLETVKRDRHQHERDHKTAQTTRARIARDITQADPEARVSTLERYRDQKLRDAAKHAANAEALNKEILGVERDLGAADQSACVCCGQALVGTDHLATVTDNLKVRMHALSAKAAGERSAENENRAEAISLEAEIATAREKAFTDIDRLHAEAEANIRDIESLAATIQAQDVAMAASVAAIADLGVRPVSMFSSRDEAYRAKQTYDQLIRDIEIEEAKINPYLDQIEDLRKTIVTIDRKPLEAARDDLLHQEFLFKLLTSKDSFIRKKIIDQNLAFLNLRMNYYLDKLGLPHRVTFQSDMSIEIKMLGREFDFPQMSRGEQNRLILANSWAFRDVWESLNHPINLIWVDEVLDFGMCDQGATSGLDVLKQMAMERRKNVFLISHKDVLIARVERTLMVHKEAEFTRFDQGGANV